MHNLIHAHELFRRHRTSNISWENPAGFPSFYLCTMLLNLGFMTTVRIPAIRNQRLLNENHRSCASHDCILPYTCIHKSTLVPVSGFNKTAANEHRWLPSEWKEEVVQVNAMGRGGTGKSWPCVFYLTLKKNFLSIFRTSSASSSVINSIEMLVSISAVGLLTSSAESSLAREDFSVVPEMPVDIFEAIRPRGGSSSESCWKGKSNYISHTARFWFAWFFCERFFYV